MVSFVHHIGAMPNKTNKRIARIPCPQGQRRANGHGELCTKFAHPLKILIKKLRFVRGSKITFPPAPIWPKKICDGSRILRVSLSPSIVFFDHGSGRKQKRALHWQALFCFVLFFHFSFSLAFATHYFHFVSFIITFFLTAGDLSESLAGIAFEISFPNVGKSDNSFFLLRW